MSGKLNILENSRIRWRGVSALRVIRLGTHRAPVSDNPQRMGIAKGRVIQKTIDERAGVGPCIEIPPTMNKFS